jgi:hypothetical protein
VETRIVQLKWTASAQPLLEKPCAPVSACCCNGGVIESLAAHSRLAAP